MHPVLACFARLFLFFVVALQLSAKLSDFIQTQTKTRDIGGNAAEEWKTILECKTKMHHGK